MRGYPRRAIATSDMKSAAIITMTNDSTTHSKVCKNTTTTLLQPFNGLFSRTTWTSQYQKGKPVWIQRRQELMGFWNGSRISWTTCKQSAPRSRQITTQTPHHSIFFRPDPLPDAQKHIQRVILQKHNCENINKHTVFHKKVL